MKILALDTSSRAATVAVMEDDRLIAEQTTNHKKTHSEKLLPIIERTLGDGSFVPQDIDVFAVSLGPGSFTGLRIGMATVKAIAQTLNKTVVGVSTIEALAYNIPYSKHLICPIIDAQRDLVYTGLFKWEGDAPSKIKEESVMNIEELIAELKEMDEKVIFLGDAVEKFQDRLKKELGTQCEIPKGAMLIPRAYSVGLLAKRQLDHGYRKELHEVIPIYMRKSQAERQYEEKLKREQEEARKKES